MTLRINGMAGDTAIASRVDTKPPRKGGHQPSYRLTHNRPGLMILQKGEQDGTVSRLTGEVGRFANKKKRTKFDTTPKYDI